MSEENRLIGIETPLEDKLKLRSISGHAELSRLFRYDLEMVCTSGEVSSDDLIKKLVGKNQSISVRIDLDVNEGERFINGHISRVRSDFSADGGTIYRAQLVPTFWFGTKTSDCRIFQDMKVTEIIETVLGDIGVKFDAKWKPRDYPELEYCVQYRETDFNFVSRLMEENGIFYFFKHAKNDHTMVIGQDQNAFEELKPTSTIHYPGSESPNRHIFDHITDWQREFSFISGQWAHTDYNFEDPGANLLSEEPTKTSLSEAKQYEMYDYPAEYKEGGEGKRRAAVRMEEEEVGFEIVQGTSSCRSFDPGFFFNVGEHPSASEKGKWVIKSVSLQATNPGFTTNSGRDGSADYINTFSCIPDGLKFRPARLTPKPIVSGLQSAVVVGASGDEIHTDEYGRIKVQFHWDRYGKRNEDSSCWIRCSQNIAGKSWGLMAIPRVGQEVMINFLEGDPDRPLVVGCVYNQQQMPAYDPKEMASRIYLKSNSTKGGDGFNEMMFEDKKDSEMVFFHAQKNMDTRVLNDSKERIFGNRHQVIGYEDNGKKGGSQYEMVYQDKEVNIKQHQQEHIEGNYSLMVGNGEASSGGALAAVIENAIAASVGKDGMEFKNDGDATTEVEGKSSQTVKGDVMEDVGSLSSTIKGEHSETCRNYSNDVESMVNVKAGMKIAYEAGTEVHIKSGASLCIESGATLTLKVGGNFININPAGVFIQGTLVGINSGGMATPGTGCMPLPPLPAMPITQPPEEAEPTVPTLAHDDKSGQPSNT